MVASNSYHSIMDARRPFGFACATLLVVLVPVLLLCSSTSVKAETEEDYCMNVILDFSPCVSFVAGFQPYVIDACCVNLLYLNRLAERDNGPRMICECIKDYSNYSDLPYNATRIQQLFPICEIHNKFPISDSMDCSK